MIGFGCNLASVSTAVCSHRWGEGRGRLASALLRDVLGIPVWVIGLALAMRAPLPSLLPATWTRVSLAWLLMALSCVLILPAFAALGWRAAMPSARDSLVEHGLYAHMRHPMYVAMLIAFVSLFLMHPSGAVALACALGAGWAVLQARLEELDLLQRLPAYGGYMVRMPRFVPHLGRARHPGPKPNGVER